MDHCSFLFKYCLRKVFSPLIYTSATLFDCKNAKSTFGSYTDSIFVVLGENCVLLFALCACAFFNQLFQTASKAFEMTVFVGSSNGRPLLHSHPETSRNHYSQDLPLILPNSWKVLFSRRVKFLLMPSFTLRVICIRLCL